MSPILFSRFKNNYDITLAPLNSPTGAPRNQNASKMAMRKLRFSFVVNAEMKLNADNTTATIPPESETGIELIKI